jgi:hypothetical protein
MLAGCGHSLKLTIAVALIALTGCQMHAVSITEMEEHQALVDHVGLASLHINDILKVTCTPPANWDQLPLTQNVLYAHQQWRSPDRHVGMGVAYMHTPVAFSPEMMIWFAKMEYTACSDGSGHLIAQWTDALGRCWFEAENGTYHVMGYAMTRGFDAWMVYSGYRVKAHPPADEVLLAARGADTVAPLGGQ